MNPLEFFIPGEPAPGGSKSAFVARRRDGSIVMRQGTNIPIVNVSDAGGKANKAWRAVVSAYGRRFMMHTKPFECALLVEFIFFLKRPQAHFINNDRERGILKADAPLYHTHAPDALKFARSTEDALTGVVWKDDSQTVKISSEKRWRNGAAQTGCTVRIFFPPNESPQPTLL